MAELEKSTITERLTMGRDRVARKGQYTGGPIPFGYDLDADRCLVPSARLVTALGITEADLVRDIFGRVASGETTMNAECNRLTASRGAPGPAVRGPPQERHAGQGPGTVRGLGLCRRWG